MTPPLAPSIAGSAVVVRTVAALALALLLGCDMRVVELAGPADASAPAAAASCTEFLRADGVTCKLCFDAAGRVTATMCPDPATGAGTAVTPPASCTVSNGGDDRCLLCRSPMLGEYRACLECEAAVPRMGGGQCRVCTWSDDANNRCLQCFNRDGIRDEDSCDGVRSTPVIYPMTADAGAGR